MKNKTIIIYIFLIILLNGCSSLKKGLGVEKDKPNEFLIEKRDPLVLPPDYKLLPPDSSNLKKENEVQKDISLENLIKSNSQDQERKVLKDTKPNPSNLEQEILNQIK